jgi:uncharacterized protein YqgV (UPF0045/DUF77 family)
MDAIKACHEAVHAMGTPRVAVSRRGSPHQLRLSHVYVPKTDIRIGTRVDKQIAKGGNAGKVSRVEEILAKEQK